MLIEIYKAWFSTGYVKVALKLRGRDAEDVSNIAEQKAQEFGWSFLGDMDYEGSLFLPANVLHLEKCLDS